MKKSLLLFFSLTSAVAFSQNISVTEMGRYTDGRDGACEISTYDKTSSKIFITNAVSDSIDIVDVSTASSPSLTGGIDITTYGGGINSVANVGGGYIAAAIEANVKQDPGKVVFFDVNGTFVSEVTVGALPDMVTVTKDGNKVLVANEGEPDDDYLIDPEGSISIIDISGGVANVTNSNVTTLDFNAAPTTIAGALQKPGTPWSDDLEPEYIAVNDASTVAVVACQEANVFIFVDLVNESITSYKGLGFKDHSVAGNGMDVSNEDNGINIALWDVKGAYQPDAISGFEVGGNTYWVSANEGDARDYDGYSSEVRIKDLTLDSIAFPNAASIQEDSVLGRLKTFTADVIGDTDNDGDVDELYSYGARSFSIWDNTGNLVWDSGDEIEQYIAANHDAFFNCNDGLAAEMDDRSDDKGPEPEAITVGKLGSRYYVFLGLERQGGVMVWDVTDPNNPVFETFINTYQNDGTMTDIAPEGLVFVPAADAHNNKNMLIVSNEVSGTTTIYDIEDLTVGTNELVAQDAEVNLYPNPTKNQVTVEVSGQNNQQINFVVLNALGAQVAAGRFNGNRHQLDLSDMPKGLYLISLTSENSSLKTTKKVIKH